jgi:hypothetical protein
VCGVSEKAEVSFHTFDPPLVTPGAKSLLDVEVGKSACTKSRLDLRLWRAVAVAES